MNTMQYLVSFIKRRNIAIQLFILIISISALASYNYINQRSLFQQQLENDTNNIVQAFRSSIEKFDDIKQTLDLQRLVHDISLGLDIFEFRYLNSEGIIINSMFKEEIGQQFNKPSFNITALAQIQESNFYMDVRDMTSVIAISHPVFYANQLIGVVDAAFDISELDYVDQNAKEITIHRMQTDIRNLLQTVAASITNALHIFKTVDTHHFLSSYVKNSKNIIQITITDTDGLVVATSDEQFNGSRLDIDTSPFSLFNSDAAIPFHRILTPLNPDQDDSHQLLLLIDATLYVKHERELFVTSLSTTIFIILFALFISYSIYRINMEREHAEKLRLEQKVKERTQEIERISQIDKLTGLSNRRHLDEMLQLEFKRSLRFKHEMSLLILDLDHFKQVNDNYGHLGGDEVLKSLGTIISSTIRETDIAGRYGGEEFVVMLPESDQRIAEHVANKLCHAVRENEFKFEEQIIPVTLSIGISVYNESTNDVQALFQQADGALYASKQNGRDRFSSYEEGMETN